MIRHHGENASAAKVLSTNSTHLIVVKYLFGGTDRCSIYIDPIPGATEPTTPEPSHPREKAILLGACSL